MSHAVENLPGSRAPGVPPGPLRILHVLAPALFGGLEQVVLALATGQAAAGHEVHAALVVDADTAAHPLVVTLQERGVATHSLVLPPRAYGEERRRMRELCGALRPDIVHTHGSRCDVLHAPVARASGVPTVSTAHGFTGGDLKNRVYEHLQRRSMRHCDAVVAVSRPLAERLARAGVPRHRLHCIPNAWGGGVAFLERERARRELGIAPAAFCIGYIGRLTAEKGPDLFIRAALAAQSSAVLVGDGSMRAQLETLVQGANAGAAIRLVGARPEAGTLMRAFDALVISSRTEGTPMVLLEAMAARVPVIATAVGGIPDVVSGAEALVVPPEDVSALADAIRELRAGPESAAARAERAAIRLNTSFGPAPWLERHENLYRDCGRAAGSRTTR